MIKISGIKLANAIRVGTNTESYFTDKHYEITMTQNLLIRIASRVDAMAVTYTSIHNCVYFVEDMGAKAGKRS